MSVAASIVGYLKHHQLVITTAESCTAGKIITLLSQVDGSGSWIESGYVVYSPEAKQRLLNVRPYTYRNGGALSVFSRKERFMGSREQVQLAASLHALKWLPHFHQRALAGERA